MSNELNLNRVVILLRSCANVGKTTFAEYLKDIFYWNPDKSCEICCADDFYTDKDGTYKFDGAKLGLAHRICKNKFTTALENGTELVIVANTNSSQKEIDFYLETAAYFKYTLFSLIVEKRFEGGDNGHLIPIESVNKQKQNILNSLKLT